jgi:O-antigen/teichoic acid export membrane protein
MLIVTAIHRKCRCMLNLSSSEGSVDIDSAGDKRTAFWIKLKRGGSSIAAATIIERGGSFLANLMAARIAGPKEFGGFSLAYNTAALVSSYTGGGAYLTTTRFTAEYPGGSPGAGRCLRLLLFTSFVSAAGAAILALVVANPMARYMLDNLYLTTLLRASALVAAALILADALRGVLVGRQQYATLIGFSICLAILSIIVIPLNARFGAVSLTLSSGACLVTATFLGGLYLIRGVSFADRRRPIGVLKPALQEIIEFSAVQVASGAAINLAGYYSFVLLSRCDSTLAEMGFYAVASQLGNLIRILPGIGTQALFPFLVPRDQTPVDAESVLWSNTALNGATTLVLGGFIVFGSAWLIPFVYGQRYAGAVPVAAVSVGSAVLHMFCSPAALRLSVVSVRVNGAINLAWAVVLIALSSLLVPRYEARGLALAYWVSYLFSAIALVVALRLSGALPRGFLRLTLPCLLGAATISLYGWTLAIPEVRSVTRWSVLLLCACIVVAACMYLVAACKRSLTLLGKP